MDDKETSESMTMENDNIGKRVQLVSGGPWMTIAKQKLIVGDDPYFMFHCIWFDSENRLQSSVFEARLVTFHPDDMSLVAKTGPPAVEPIVVGGVVS